MVEGASEVWSGDGETETMNPPYVQYKVFRTKVTPDGVVPDGDAVGILTLINGRPEWSELARDFEVLGLPAFESPRAFAESGGIVCPEPYSPEALTLARELLLSKGFLLQGPSAHDIPADR